MSVCLSVCVCTRTYICVFAPFYISSYIIYVSLSSCAVYPPGPGLLTSHVGLWRHPRMAGLHPTGSTGPTGSRNFARFSSMVLLCLWKFATSNKCIASSNKCLTSSNKKLLVTKGIATRSVRTLLGAPGHTRNKGIATNVASCYVRNYLKHCVPQFAHFRSLVLCDTCDRGKGVNHRPPMKGLNLTLVTTSLHKSSLILVAMHLLLVAYCFYS